MKRLTVGVLCTFGVFLLAFSSPVQGKKTYNFAVPTLSNARVLQTFYEDLSIGCPGIRSTLHSLDSLTVETEIRADNEDDPRLFGSVGHLCSRTSTEKQGTLMGVTNIFSGHKPREDGTYYTVKCDLDRIKFTPDITSGVLEGSVMHTVLSAMLNAKFPRAFDSKNHYNTAINHIYNRLLNHEWACDADLLKSIEKSNICRAPISVLPNPASRADSFRRGGGFYVNGALKRKLGYSSESEEDFKKSKCVLGQGKTGLLLVMPFDKQTEVMQTRRLNWMDMLSYEILFLIRYNRQAAEEIVRSSLSIKDKGLKVVHSAQVIFTSNRITLSQKVVYLEDGEPKVTVEVSSNLLGNDQEIFGVTVRNRDFPRALEKVVLQEGASGARISFDSLDYSMFPENQADKQKEEEERVLPVVDKETEEAARIARDKEREERMRKQMEEAEGRRQEEQTQQRTVDPNHLVIMDFEGEDIPVDADLRGKTYEEAYPGAFSTVEDLTAWRQTSSHIKQQRKMKKPRSG